MAIFENDDQTHEKTVQQLQSQVQYHALFSELIKHPKDLFPDGITNFIRDFFLGKNCVINEEGVIQSSSQSSQFSSLGDRIHKRISIIVEEARYRDTILNVSRIKVQRTKTHVAREKRLRFLYPNWEEFTLKNQRELRVRYKKHQLKAGRWIQASKKLSYGCIILGGGLLVSQIEYWAYPSINLNDLLDYICQHYPEVVEIFQLLDPLVQGLITNEKPLPSVNLDDLRKRIKTCLKQK